jgi:hypothetical protein
MDIKVNDKVIRVGSREYDETSRRPKDITKAGVSDKIQLVPSSKQERYCVYVVGV